MKILVISQMYPSGTTPHFGIFIQREVESLSGYCEQKVVVPRPWIPWKKVSYLQDESHKAHKNIHNKSSSIEVLYTTYFPLPGRFFMPIKGLWLFLFNLHKVIRMKKGFDFDIIHAHKAYPEGFCAALFKKVFKKPVVISIRGADINKLPTYAFVRPMVRYALKNADSVIAVSKSLKHRVMALGISEDKVSVMPKGVDMELFKPMDRTEVRKDLDLPREKIIILSVGWLIPRKNPFAFIKAALSIRHEERNKYLFVWVGEGPLKDKMESEIQEKDIESMFLLAGRVDPFEIPLWMNAADIFVLVSFSEGMPNVLYEAMACGSAVIASNVDGAAEIIEDKQNGVLVSPHDYQQINEQIQALAANEALRKKIGQSGRAFMESKKLDWGNNALWLIRKYQQVLLPDTL